MRRLLRWLPPILLGSSALAGVVTAATIEARVPDERAAAGPSAPRLGTPVLSVRRLPSVLAAPVAERRLYADLDAWLTVSPGDTCVVVRGGDGDLAWAARGDAPMVPASTQKLLTATAVLLRLGADTTFRTTAVASAATTTAGVVVGDLTLVGGGDPLLASPDYVARYRRQPQVFTDLDQLAAELAATGIRRVEGSVVGDESRYDAVRYVPGWPPRYIDQDQTGPLSGLTVNDGFESYPRTPAGGELVAAPDPARNAATVLTRLLEARGVDVVGEPRSGRAPVAGAELATLESPPLGEVVRQLLEESDNTTAELLVKELGAASGAPTTAGGLAQVRLALTEAGIDLTGATPADGSGLSLAGRVTCALLVDLLTRPATGPVLVERLAVAGRSGTLAERFGGTPLEGHLQAKTGSLNTVSALAGVVADDDPPLTFAYLVNVPEPDRIPPEVGAAQQALGEILLGWPRVPGPAVLGPLPLAPP